MNKLFSIVALSGVLGCAFAAPATTINGAGSSFVYPAMSSWTNDYYNKTGKKINYQSIGSTGGLNLLKAHTVSFAATDVPQQKSDLQANKWVQYPIIMGGIVPIVNLQGVGPNQLTLNGQVLAAIYSGKISKWNDPAIQKLNPNMQLPSNRIITVHRSDGSGTTYNFTNYLSTVSPAFKQQVGTGTFVQWPTASLGIGGKGNAGVATQVQNIKNSIGYVEYAYAKEAHLDTAAMQNAAGKRVVPNASTFASAASMAPWASHPDYDLLVTDSPGANSWPIMATTFVLLPTTDSNRAAVNAFLKWVYNNGNASAQQLDYATLPQSLRDGIVKQLG